MPTQPVAEVSLSAYSAAGPALGYLAQIEYALLLLLQKMDDEEQCEISIEALDDVTFHANDGSALEQIQTKHHISKGAHLSDASTDLWKTLHNWIVERTLANSASRLVLLTTSEASVGSAAHLLRHDDNRDIGAVAGILAKVARESTNEGNQRYYRAYLALSDEERRSLLSRTYIADSATNVGGIDKKLSIALRHSVPRDRRGALIERLRGWWYKRAIKHLHEVAKGTIATIAALEVEDCIHAIALSLHDENLPIDYEEEPYPDEGTVDSDIRIFVEQLKIIAMSNRRIRMCIHDHNRAYLQRSRWQRDRLLHVSELAAYDARLKDEWRRHFIPLQDDAEEVGEAEVCRLARNAHRALDTSTLPQIRLRVLSGYVASGSLHLLADRLQVGWHPEWVSHLRDRIAEVREAIVSEGVA
jgi:hypothetical protein